MGGLPTSSAVAAGAGSSGPACGPASGPVEGSDAGPDVGPACPDVGPACPDVGPDAGTDALHARQAQPQRVEQRGRGTQGKGDVLPIVCHSLRCVSHKSGKHTFKDYIGHTASGKRISLGRLDKGEG